jgi:cell division protein FtsB
MIRQFFAHIAKIVSEFIQHSLKVFVTCLILVSMGFLLNGSLFRLWRLNRDSRDLTQRMQVLRKDTTELEKKIKRAQDPNFIELEAREKFDLASEGDLIFVFSDEE